MLTGHQGGNDHTDLTPYEKKYTCLHTNKCRYETN